MKTSITKGQLNRLIAESINEELQNEGWWGNLKNAVGKGISSAYNQGGGMRQAWNAGRQQFNQLQQNDRGINAYNKIYSNWDNSVKKLNALDTNSQIEQNEADKNYELKVLEYNYNEQLKELKYRYDYEAEMIRRKYDANIQNLKATHQKYKDETYANFDKFNAMRKEIGKDRYDYSKAAGIGSKGLRMNAAQYDAYQRRQR